MRSEDVVIVGGGPTGLLLGCELALAGVHPVVLERRSEPSTAPKANGLAGQIVQLLDYRGLLETLSAEASFVGPLPEWEFGSVPLEFSRLPASPMHAVLIQQPAMETVLRQRADELSVEVRHGHELTALASDGDEVTIEVCGPGGDYMMRTRYVVGCDGGGSVVRRMGGIEFPGSTGSEVVRIGHFTVLVTEGFRDDDNVESARRPTVIRTSNGRVMMMSVRPGIRLVAVSENAPRTESGPMTLGEFQASVRRVMGDELPLGEPIWLTHTTSHARLANTYKQGRVLLAGDAAHLFPGGGSALNVGLTDAFNLGWKLAAEVRGRAPRGLLDTYHTERYPAAQRTLIQTRAQVFLHQCDDEDGAALRTLLSELLEFDQPLEHLGRILAGSDIRYPMPGGGPHPLVGRLVPDLPLQTADRGPVRVTDLMRTGRPLLLDFTNTDALHGMSHPWIDRIATITATCDNPPAPALLIRPDGYIAWAADQQANLEEALTHWFGTNISTA
ncbi:putative monooxygenase [Nocardia nova SH22a]|uniref:Putative monooxygenase n=1 Tax=Nocardia nova SH22a TaxID=1415166 RepID=W5TIZ6_9NOCA|nr:FAD-dependent monooxygenase [Nocardia nova]AHH17226.1 putative monooxygenase [Nocardia nova SH22a]